jgi:hypothetical protein
MSELTSGPSHPQVAHPIPSGPSHPKWPSPIHSHRHARLSDRCRDGSVDGETLELLIGAEMTRRTFTNCCNIMRRHGFVREWKRWRKERGMPEL